MIKLLKIKYNKLKSKKAHIVFAPYPACSWSYIMVSMC